MLVLIMLGLLIQVCFMGMASLHDLRQHVVPFLKLYGLAYLGYGVAVIHLLRRPTRRHTFPLILGLAVLFRVTLLFTSPPTLSDDVYRYVWDGRLTNAGVNPYAHAVESPSLDRFDTPQRALVNHARMASPYLPTAQLFFAVVYRLFPNSPLAFQVAAVLLDLLAGCLVAGLLRQLGLPRAWALIYLWNPLVVVEFTHGAHVDALMICLMMAALWAWIVARSTLASALGLAATTLIKGLTALLLPVMAARWSWRQAVVYGGLALTACLPFGLGAGWGLTGPLDGKGLFGAFRIYTDRWNFNGGLYHWLEVGLSGYQTPGAVPPEIVGHAPILAAKLLTALALGLTLLVVWRMARRCDDDLALLRLAAIPLAAYLLLATTVHPWYYTPIIALLPFLPSRKKKSFKRRTELPPPSPGDSSRAAQRRREGIEGGAIPKSSKASRFLLPALYFAAVVPLSYLTYRDPTNLREYNWVRFVEYAPLYLLLLWSARPASGGADPSDTD